MCMITMSQIRPKHLDIGPLPPMKEAFLEIQVNELINEILFSDDKGGKKSPQEDRIAPLELKENAATSSMPYQYSSDMNVLMNSIGNAPSMNPPRDLQVSYCESLHGLSRLPQTNDEQRVIRKEHEMCCGSNVKALESGYAVCWAMPMNAYMETEGKISHDGPYLNRMETFPCQSKAHKLEHNVSIYSSICASSEQLPRASYVSYCKIPHGQAKQQIVSRKEQEMGCINVNVTCGATSVSTFLEKKGKASQDRPHLGRMESFPCTSRMHMLEEDACEEASRHGLHSCRKPPRPPRLSSVVRPLPGLTKCGSYTGFLSQNRRKFKLERRRVSRVSNTSASICALVFTLCFMGLTIAQGFWHKGSGNAAVKGNDVAFSTLTNHNSNLNIVAVPFRTMGVHNEPAIHDSTKETSDWVGSYFTPTRLRSWRVLKGKNLDPDDLMKS